MKLIYRAKQLMLIGGDFLCFVFGFWLSLLIRYLRVPVWSDIEKHLVLFFFLFLLWLVINFINGLYDLGKFKRKETTRYFVEAAAISFLVSIIFFYALSNSAVAPKTILILNVLIGYGLSYLWRVIYEKFIGQKSLINNVIFVGYTPETQELIDIIQNNPEGGYKIVSMIDPEHAVKSSNFPFFDVYHSVQAVRPAVTNHHAHVVVIAPHLRQNTEVSRELYELLFWKVQISDQTTFYEVITGRIPPSTFSEAWFLENLKNSRQPIYEKLRAFFDFVAGISVGVICVCLFPFIAIALKASSPGHIFYKQKRVGQGGREFFLYKFRSMYVLKEDGSAEIDGAQFTTKDDKRVTATGKFLRKTRLDELPQFINLLKRDITLIGPRPERPEIVQQAVARLPYYSLRHMVRPGLTGWAVIRQNYTDNLEKTLQKLQYDLYYIKHRSVLMDISILLRTVNIVLRMMGQ